MDDFSYKTIINNAIKLYGESRYIDDLTYGIIVAKIEIDENVDFYSKAKSVVTRLRKKIINENSFIGLMNTAYRDFRYTTYTKSFDGKLSLLNWLIRPSLISKLLR